METCSMRSRKRHRNLIPPQSTFTPDSTLENLVGLLAVDNRGANPEEEEFIRRIKRKKRRKRKR